MYGENDQFVETSYDGDIPSEKFYSEMGYPRASVTPIFKPFSEVEQNDLYTKRVFEAENVEELINEIKGTGVLHFRYDGEDLDMGSKYQGGEIEFNVSEQGKAELETIESVLEEHSGDINYKWSTNTNSYLSMDDLKSGLSCPVSIMPGIQGVSGMSYEPHSELEIRHFSQDMVEISDSYIESQLEELGENTEKEAYGNLLEKNLRRNIEKSKETQEIEVMGRCFEVEEEDWRIRDYPVDTDAIKSITEELEGRGFQVRRIRLGPSQQPNDRDLIITDYEEV